MPSPFPGMDPYLEDPARWPDVHVTLVTALRDALMQRLRPRYVVRVEERVYVTGEDEEELIRPDLAVLPRPPAAAPPQASTGRVPVPVVVATVIAAEQRERFLEVRAPDSGEVVTVIEVLSPTNKRGPRSAGRESYLAKRRAVLASPAHLVELDLLRAGARAPMAGPLPPGDYHVIVSHAERRPRCEVYPLSLRAALPVIPFPLRGEEAVEVDLQAVLEDVYARGGYDLDVDYDRPPVPPLAPDDAAWARERVAAWRAGRG
ncbi:MAG: DUF4058 family protein [Planctomycetes bacterium]|nr:DUF4058 family protein [Planctomycetota bacterium]